VNMHVHEHDYVLFTCARNSASPNPNVSASMGVSSIVIKMVNIITIERRSRRICMYKNMIMNSSPVLERAQIRTSQRRLE